MIRAAVLTLLVLVFCGLALLPVEAQAPQEQPTAFEMFGALNEWRLEQNLAPFRYNATLEALAWFQLEHILALPDIPPNIHDGILQEGPRDRALWPPFEWPYYDIPARLNLVEIIVAQKTVQQGIDWWKHSDIHRRAATNPNYREVGVAALPYPNGTVFVAVLGGRPDVLPATIHPDREALYLTRESFWGATAGNGYLVNITDVRLLDSDETPLTDWQPWRATLPMPEVSGDHLYVEYTDGDLTVQTEVNLERDVFLLPGYEEELAPFSTMSASAMGLLVAEATETQGEIGGAELTLTVNGAESLLFEVETAGTLFLDDFQIFALLADVPTVVWPFAEAFDSVQYAGPGSCFIYAVEGTALDLPESCTGLVVAKQIPPEDVFWIDTAWEVQAPMFVLNMRGGLLANCRDAAAACTFHLDAAPIPAGFGGEVAQPVSREIWLVYSPRSLAVINSGGQFLNLYGLTLQQGSSQVDATDWRQSNPSADLGYFPANDCLQVGVLGRGSPVKPAECHIRHAWFSVNPSQAFWEEGEFEVLFNGAPVTTCQASAGKCVFQLP
jgi:hypothetical protein